MELRILEREKKVLTVEVVSPDDTVIYPLISHLLKDDRVEDARYVIGHPFLDKPTIVVRVKRGKKDNPETVLQEAASGLAGKYGEMREQFQAALEKAA